MHGRKHSYRLYTKMLNEAMRWANAIQGAIDSKVPIETPTQQLIRDIKVLQDSLFLPLFAEIAYVMPTITVWSLYFMLGCMCLTKCAHHNFANNSA